MVFCGFMGDKVLDDGLGCARLYLCKGALHLGELVEALAGRLVDIGTQALHIEPLGSIAPRRRAGHERGGWLWECSGPGSAEQQARRGHGHGGGMESVVTIAMAEYVIRRAG
jgi:hypothetical protein